MKKLLMAFCFLVLCCFICVGTAISAMGITNTAANFYDELAVQNNCLTDGNYDLAIDAPYSASQVYEITILKNDSVYNQFSLPNNPLAGDMSLGNITAANLYYINVTYKVGAVFCDQMGQNEHVLAAIEIASIPDSFTPAISCINANNAPIATHRIATINFRASEATVIGRLADAFSLGQTVHPQLE